MEGVIKLARQYFYETRQPQRTNFIARQLSFHGNTLSTLSLACHPARRAPYEAVLNHENFHHVSPAYAKRFQKPDETEEQYVERLRQELEDRFIELGPDTVVGCEQLVLNANPHADEATDSSRRRNRCGRNDGCGCCAEGLLQGHEIGVRQIRRSVHPR